MAHLSGYDGTLTMTDIDCLTKITEWAVFAESDEIRGYAKQDPWETVFLGAAKWRAEVQFLVQDTHTLDALIAGQPESGCTFLMKTGAVANLEFAGSGQATNIKVNDPPDGPVTGSCTITGNGTLSQTKQADV